MESKAIRWEDSGEQRKLEFLKLNLKAYKFNDVDLCCESKKAELKDIANGPSRSVFHRIKKGEKVLTLSLELLEKRLDNMLNKFNLSYQDHVIENDEYRNFELIEGLILELEQSLEYFERTARSKHEPYNFAVPIEKKYKEILNLVKKIKSCAKLFKVEFDEFYSKIAGICQTVDFMIPSALRLAYLKYFDHDNFKFRRPSGDYDSGTFSSIEGEFLSKEELPPIDKLRFFKGEYGKELRELQDEYKSSLNLLRNILKSQKNQMLKWGLIGRVY